MTTEFLVKTAVTLTPKYSGTTAPQVLIAVPGKVVRYTLLKQQRVELEFTAPFGWLEVIFFNKPELDHDMAVVVDSVEFFGISDPRFVWQGEYRPKYPEPWYSQQLTKPESVLSANNYMGWNGTWRLNFSVPVFTWMHQVQGLGWIYQ